MSEYGSLETVPELLDLIEGTVKQMRATSDPSTLASLAHDLSRLTKSIKDRTTEWAFVYWMTRSYESKPKKEK